MLLREYRGETIPFGMAEETRRSAFLTRVDPLSGRVSKISEERARRSIGISSQLNIQPAENCTFCGYVKSTPQQRVKHDCGAVSVPNLFPWEKYDWITIYPPFGRHKMLLSELYFDDLERMIESSYELADMCSRDDDVLEFMDFTNWGTFAGASQQHPHSQRKSVTSVPSPRLREEMSHCRELYRRYGKNPFDLLEHEEREDGRRVIYNDGVYIGAAFAPTCSDEIIIFPSEPISHVLDTGIEYRRRLIRPVLGVFPALFFYRGVTDLNIAVHMAPFGQRREARHYYRWHMHVYPRRSRLPVDKAGAEIGFGTDIVDTLPEKTAEALRCWYREGPREDLVARGKDGAPDPALVAQLRNLTLSGR